MHILDDEQVQLPTRCQSNYQISDKYTFLRDPSNTMKSAKNECEFKYLMHITPAVIVGSCTMKMLTDTAGSTQPQHCLTEASPAGLFNVVTTAPSTADMVFMSAGGLTVLYPEWTFKGTAVRNHSAVRTAQDKTWAASSRGVVTSLMKKSKTMWRLATQCRNPSCPFNTNANGHAPQLPATPMPDDLQVYNSRKSELHITALLSPALQMQICRHAVWHKGNLAPPGSHTSTSRGRKTYHVMADAVTDAPARIYLLQGACNGFAPPNALIREVAGIDDHAEDVTGNVLVVKHAWKNKHKVVDCTTNDIETSTMLLKEPLGNPTSGLEKKGMMRSPLWCTFLTLMFVHPTLPFTMSPFSSCCVCGCCRFWLMVVAKFVISLFRLSAMWMTFASLFRVLVWSV
ncbi:hypothetical protein EV702DRAFT_1050850 [Suillus placidus]|uniref:Uncharacterized protein n=1 Tax=Suillus placidus TaxID=48579 RepID=A0A9P7CVK6_9AGAM|nr:hypothetical protein EV702DRAFT_1050850 [Suillus placidus]